MIKIAMIEDDEELAYLLSSYLKKYDMEVCNHPDPFVGLAYIESNIEKFDLIILDLSLPGLDGIEICEKLIKYNKPIIISSARSDIKDKIKTLEMGADDYLAKPYEPRELELKIRAVLRRYEKIPLLKDEQKDTLFKIESDTVFYKNRPLSLTQAELQVLTLLIKRANCIVSRFDIYDECDFFKSEDCSGSLNVIINRIKKKIGKKHIQTVKGVGYRLQC